MGTEVSRLEDVFNSSERKEGLRSVVRGKASARREMCHSVFSFCCSKASSPHEAVCELRQSTVTSIQFLKIRGSTIIQYCLLRYGRGSTSKAKYVTIYGTLPSDLVIGFSIRWLLAQTRVTAPDADFWIG